MQSPEEFQESLDAIDRHYDRQLDWIILGGCSAFFLIALAFLIATIRVAVR